MADEGVFPKSDGDIAFASEYNDFGLLSTETETEDTTTYTLLAPSDWTEKATFTLSVPNKARIVGVKIEFEYQRTAGSGGQNFAYGAGIRISKNNVWTNGPPQGVTNAAAEYLAIFAVNMNGTDGAFVGSGDIYVSLPDSGDYDSAAQTRTLSFAMAGDNRLSNNPDLSIKNINVTTYYLHLEH